jgi:hypothetical protein
MAQQAIDVAEGGNHDPGTRERAILALDPHPQQEWHVQVILLHRPDLFQGRRNDP